MKGNFKIVMLVICIIAAVFGILVFAGLITIGSDKNEEGSLGTVIIWGTDKMQNLAKPIENFNKVNTTFTVKYVQKDAETFDEDLLEALASGTGPDMFFISNELAHKYSNKIYTIPYTSYPLASFKGTFASAGDVFLTSNGVLAFPLTIDPIVMYYNRSILDSSNVIYPPTNWTELTNLVPSITVKDGSNKISTSTVALGQFSNILHAKDILVTLFMQAGNSIVTESNGTFSSVLDSTDSKYSLSSMLEYYTNFSDPLSDTYSWNKSLANSQDYFSSENLAFYFGYASEMETLVNKNPNLNFLVSAIPQIENSKTKVTNSKVTGIAISSFSKNFSTAFTAASLMSTGSFASDYIKATSYIPARRDLLSEKKTDAFSPIFYASALYAKSWIDPSSEDTNDIFRTMIDGTLSNSLSTNEAIKDSSAKLDLLLAK
ncbi:MAG TPA: extracellular solute-binding protein [Candidatus Paceibacterota bacterium]|nr:extracellular solute-binding protein [Candidatus Paceibacterota bacterium]HPT18192.1 extracellular solute-binding protein [Candidatus Paceibacterota bacterium]